MSSPTFKNATSAGTTTSLGAASLAISSPTCSVGDLLFLTLAIHNSGGTTPSGLPTGGWALLTNTSGGPTVGTGPVSYYLYTKTADSTDAAGTSYTASVLSATKLSLACLSYTPGVIDIYTTNGTVAGDPRTTSWVSPTLNVTGARTIVEFYAIATSSTGISFSQSVIPPNVRIDAAASSPPFQFLGQRVIDEIQAAAGTTTARTVTCTQTGVWGGITVALSSPPDPIITASLTQNNLDVSALVNIVNAAGPPFTYTIDYGDGTTDSFATSSFTHTFTHTYADTTPKTIKVQVYTGSPSSSDGDLSSLSAWTQDGGTWTLDTTVTPNVFKVISASGGTAGTRFGGAFSGYYAMIHNNGFATIHFTANTRHATSAGGDGFALAFNPATGSGYKISWDGGTFDGGIQLYRFTSDVSGVEVANAVGQPIPTGNYDAKIECIYNSSTGAISVYFDSIASGLTTLRISYTDSTPLTGTWFGMLEWFSNLGAGKWWNWSAGVDSTVVLSNIVLLYPIWVTTTASSGNQRTDFYPRHTAQRLSS